MDAKDSWKVISLAFPTYSLTVLALSHISLLVNWFIIISGCLGYHIFSKHFALHRVKHSLSVKKVIYTFNMVFLYEICDGYFHLSYNVVGEVYVFAIRMVC